MARRKDVLEAVAAYSLSLGASRALAFPVDFSNQTATEHAIQEAAKALGGIDVLVLNHIVGYFDSWAVPSGRLSSDALANLFAVNTLSYITAATAALPHLEESRGSISVVSSAAAKMGMPMVAPYSASKHALRELKVIQMCAQTHVRASQTAFSTHCDRI
jgi:NAD(P)-dependent dehydrogenase (short-subunit alcohol dehydrogenase family)